MTEFLYIGITGFLKYGNLTNLSKTILDFSSYLNADFPHSGVFSSSDRSTL